VAHGHGKKPCARRPTARTHCTGFAPELGRLLHSEWTLAPNWGSRLKTLLSLDASDGIDDEKRHRGRVSLRRRMRGRLLIQRGILSDGEVEGFKKLTENVTEGGVPYVERRVRLPRFCRLLELVIVEQATVQEGNTR